MNAKLDKIDELSKLLSDKDSLSRNLISLCKHFHMSKIMGGCGIVKGERCSEYGVNAVSAYDTHL